MKRNTFTPKMLLYFLVLTSTLIFSACRSTADSPVGTPTEPAVESPTEPAEESPPTTSQENPVIEELVIAVDRSFPANVPALTTLRHAIIRDVNMYDSLLHRDAVTGKPVESLAISWNAIDDLTWEFELRQGVTYHNGENFDASDVKFTFDRILAPDSTYAIASSLQTITDVSIVDDYTIRMETSKPFPTILEALTFAPILPQDYFEEVGEEGFSAAPVGTGPFKFTEERTDQYLLMERYEDYWRGPASIEAIRWRIIPEVATQVAELKTGGVDVIRNLSPDLVEEIEATPGLYVTTSPILRLSAVYLYTQDGVWQDVLNRQAANYAIDWDTIINEVLSGHGQRAATVVSPLAFGYDPSIEPYPYDPEMARQLLATSGYLDNPVPVPLHTSQVEGTFRGVFDAIVAYLEEAGFNIEPVYTVPGPEYTRMLTGGTLEPIGSFYESWGYLSTFDADAGVSPFLTASGTFGKWLGTYVDLEGLIAEANSTVDSDLRAQLYSQIQQILRDEAYHAVGFAHNDILGVNNRVDVSARPDEWIWLWDAKPNP